MPDYEFGVIDHPLSSAGDAGHAAMARATVEQARTQLMQV
jgi:hypothetical protein